MITVGLLTFVEFRIKGIWKFGNFEVVDYHGKWKNERWEVEVEGLISTSAQGVLFGDQNWQEDLHGSICNFVPDFL